MKDIGCEVVQFVCLSQHVFSDGQLEHGSDIRIPQNAKNFLSS
jgi:hypothetical protein